MNSLTMDSEEKLKERVDPMVEEGWRYHTPY